MHSPFPGFSPEALKFLKSLKKNNDREWFQPRKPKFEELLRDPMVALCGNLNEHLRKFAPDYVGDPAKALFRIYRDTRFSNNKLPYKTHVSAVFRHRALPRNTGAGFYFEVSPEGVGIGGGIYHPGPELLKLLRQHIVNETAAFRKEIGKKAVVQLFGDLQTEAMTRVPRGFDPRHEAADLLRARSLFFYAELPAEAALLPTLEKEIATRFRAIAGFVELLDRPLFLQKQFRLDAEM